MYLCLLFFFFINHNNEAHAYAHETYGITLYKVFLLTIQDMK